MKNLKKSLVDKIKIWFNKINRLLEMQLFMMLISWPILLYWGLPLSIMSPIGNIIFAPFLTIFIIISSLIFFSELLSMPNNFLIKCLDLISNLWIKPLKWSSKTWLIICKYPNIYFLITIPIITLLIIYNQKLSSSFLRITVLITFMSFNIINFKYLNNNINTDITLLNKDILFISEYGLLIDQNSALNQSISSFALTTTIVKKGINKIKHLIVTNPSSNCFKNIKALLNIITIKNIYLPLFKGNLNQKGWLNWQNLLEITKKERIKLYLINENVTIKLPKEKEIIINIKDKTINKNKLIYKKIAINLEKTI